MTDCRNPEIQDLLPDYVAASLDAAQMSMVEQHLSNCAPCGDDVLLLRRVRALPLKSVEIDVARIVAALPQPSVRPTLRLEPRSESSLTRAGSTNQNLARSPRWSASVWQVAAAIGVMVVGGASVLVTRSAPSRFMEERSSQARLAEVAESAFVGSPSTLATTGGRVASAESLTATTSSGAGSTGRVSVSYGDLGDYSEAELQRMLDRLERWDGTSSTEPFPTLPVVASPGGY